MDNSSDVDWSWKFGCGTIKGSRGMHQVQFMTIKDPTPCHYHHLSYFCGH
jgi:hypothetical protein